MALLKEDCGITFLLQIANKSPDSIAIYGCERQALTYGELYKHIENVVQKLRALGIAQNHRVAIVLPNGPEMATAFLAVAAGAVCAPLNPKYQTKEFDFYLSDLGAKALIVMQQEQSCAMDVAKKRGIKIITLIPDKQKAGLFSLDISTRPKVFELYNSL